jgi:hypothetical protein
MPAIWKLWRDRGRGETAAQQAQRQLEERATLAADYRFVFGNEAGQRVLADILHRAGVMLDPYDAHPPNAAYNAGKRRTGLDIIEMINADPADQQRLGTTGQTEDLF